MGNEINALIAKIDEKELENLTIPITANIGGNYSSPNVTTNMTSGIKALTSKLVEIQKQKLINQGKDKVKGLLGDVLGGNSSENDTTKTKNDVDDVLGTILGGSSETKDPNETKTDSIIPKTEEDVVKEKAKDILGGLFGNKKKKEDISAKKDTIN